MHIISLALGGCIKGQKVEYGLTEDTGGHIAYILGEMRALSQHPAITTAEVVTRLFDDPALGAAYAKPREILPCGTILTRIDSGNRRYLAKEALAADREAFVEAFVAELQRRPRLPDVIHAHFADAADVACKVRERLGIPYIYTAHSLAIDKLDAVDGLDEIALRSRIAEEDRAIRCADAVVGSSRDECERQLLRYPGASPSRIHRLRPGVQSAEPAIDRQPARELVAPFLREPEKPIILAIARPVQKKNLCALVQAYAGNEALQDAANLVVLAGLRNGLTAGEDEQRAVLAELVDTIDRHNLYGKVAYPPRHTQAQVQSLYALAKESGGVFVNPALTEPYGLTLVEAASHGLPVVATQNGGPKDIVAELEHGTLVDPRDTAAIGTAIADLLADREAWIAASRNGRNNVRSMSWGNYANGIVALAQEILAPLAQKPARGQPNELLVCDIDNTLTGCQQGAQRFCNYLTRQDKVGFCVATGRSLIEARRILREWNLPSPRVLITSVGSEIYWHTHDSITLDEDYARAIAQDWQPEHIDEVLNGMPGIVHQTTVEQRRWKRSYFTNSPDAAERVKSRLAEAGLPARVIHSHGRLLDVLPTNAGKGAAVRHVARKMRVPPERIVAVGDSGNDLDMLKQSRNAVLVNNYDADLTSIAKAPNVYVARRSHAGGAMEGHILHTRRRKAAVIRETRERTTA